MRYLHITKENIDREHICCAMSGRQSLAKKEWMKQRFDEGLVFYRSEERGKCFIEYIPAENAWVPIRAEGWLYIDCLWIAGALKGHGYANELLGECMRDAAARGKAGVCILSAEGRKREFLADPKFLAYKGFRVADRSDCGITLMYLPLVPGAEPPKFKDCARHPEATGEWFVLYYTDQCPFTYYWVPQVQAAAGEHGVPLRVSISPTKKPRKTPPRRSRPMPCSGTANLSRRAFSQTKNFWHWRELLIEPCCLRVPSKKKRTKRNALLETRKGGFLKKSPLKSPKNFSATGAGMLGVCTQSNASADRPPPEAVSARCRRMPGGAPFTKGARGLSHTLSATRPFFF